MKHHHLDRLIDFLSRYNLIKNLNRSDFYFDEPPLHHFSVYVHSRSSYFKTENFYVPKEIYGAGSSFFDQEEAFGKALGESLERICQESIRLSTIQYHRYADIKKDAIDPAIHTKDTSVRNSKLGWVEGKTLSTEKPVLIPAQYAHYAFCTYKPEPQITTLISTGGAFGFTKEEALLAGLYELIERDAFITTYLIKAPVVKIAVNSIKNKQIQTIQTILQKKLLQWHLFDISTDLRVPVFLSLLIDKTGVGPALTAGASARMDSLTAIINSVTEATMSRPWVRASITENSQRYDHITSSKDMVKRRLERAFYWFHTRSLPQLSFWLGKKGQPFNKRTISFANKGDELSAVLNNIGASYKTFYYDLTHPLMRPYNLFVYKVINPSLHGLYLNEEETRIAIDPERLQNVAAYYNMSTYELNPIPHPFL